MGKQLPRRLEPGLGNQDVPRPRREEVRDIEAATAALEAGNPLLEEDSLDHLGLGEVRRARHPDLAASRVLRLDLARPLVRLGDGPLLAPPHVDERHPAVGTEALLQWILAGTAGT